MNAPTRPGVHALLDMAPLKNWPESRWNEFVSDAQAFRMTWGARAVELGWTPLEMFAVSRTHPYALHAWGAVLFINGKKVSDVTADTIWIETGREKVDTETGEVTPAYLRIPKRKVSADVALPWNVAT